MQRRAFVKSSSLKPIGSRAFVKSLSLKPMRSRAFVKIWIIKLVRYRKFVQMCTLKAIRSRAFVKIGSLKPIRSTAFIKIWSIKLVRSRAFVKIQSIKLVRSREFVKICKLKILGKIYFKFKRLLRYIQPFGGRCFYLQCSLLLFNFVGAITMMHFLIIFTNCSFQIWCAIPYSFTCYSEPGCVQRLCARSKCALFRIALIRSWASYKNHTTVVTVSRFCEIFP